MNKSRPTRTSKGVLYVSVAEFAKREGVTRRAIQTAITKGLLPSKVFPGDASFYIDWNKGKEIWDNRPKPKRKTIGQIQKEMEASGFTVPDSPEIKEISETEEVREIGEISDGKETFSLQSLDPRGFSDCWIYAKDEKTGKRVPLINQETGEHIYNWDLVDKKLKALLHDLQYQAKQGSLIPKEDVEFTLATIFQPLVSDIMQIPNTYTSSLLSIVEDYLSVPVDSTLRTALTNALKETSNKILKNFQETIKKALDA